MESLKRNKSMEEEDKHTRFILIHYPIDRHPVPST